MFQENWIDVDEELGLEGLPLLDELPPLLEPAFSAPVSPEKSCSYETETTSAAGSAVESDNANSPKDTQTRTVATSSRFQKATTNPNEQLVCFIGNFPPQCDLIAFQRFVDERDVQTTEIRLGPRKKAHASAMSFAYADMSSEDDFNRLLAFDGMTYLGRKIRIDQATPHRPPKARGQKAQLKRSPYFGSRRSNLRRSLKNHHSAPMPKRSTYQQDRATRANRFSMNRGPRNFNKRSPKQMRRRPSREGDKTNAPFSRSRFSSEPGRPHPRFGRRN